MSEGSHSSFNRQWALGSKHTAPSEADALAASQNILGSLRKRRGSETAQWMNKLASEISLDPQSSVNSQQEAKPVLPEDIKEHELTRWLNKLFSQFDIFANQFNQTAQGTDLLVACTPATVIDRPASDEEVDIKPEKIYEGHLVTRYWAMFLRGTAGIIDIFIIPSEMLLGFSLHKIDESIYSPLLVIESDWKNDQLTWHIGGTSISQNQIPLLAKELFGDLVRVASGQMNESELFAHPLQEMNLGENLAIGYKAPAAAATATPAPAAPQFANAAPAAAAPTATKSPVLKLTSIDVAKQMLMALDADTNQLSQIGKAALNADNDATFKKIEALATKLETIKQPFKAAFAEIFQLANTLDQTKE